MTTTAGRIGFTLWATPATAPSWVSSPTIEIERVTDDDVIWAFSLRELPEPRGNARHIQGYPAWAKDGPELHLSIFAEGLAALADPDIAWLFTALAEHRPATVTEVAEILAAGGVIDRTAEEAAAQGLPQPQATR
ncbi:hypothetical protein A5789_09205 [Nocardia sp. 852002-51101_SCH5132738]|uniref:hypothetical protein n=1 Tax=Nocardia sp. 852002-51101_SCH5132738 TaxID=1834095 RepID=UPI0007EA9E91|nr:hypothetical protein [Nocardia sp. 852002-51101_SCH5132738]OBA44458.1 hypothetical protein A5789_09205 [Nocardia sp. 852002-51101_SCH5132738]